MVASPPIITSLRADIVPQREFALRKWFYARPSWYYHRRGLTDEINPNARFYKLIDPELRDLCRMLHDAGIHTTPSCQGHFYSRAHFENVWDALEHDEALIQSTGLLVRDSETDQRYCFRAVTYQLPWSDFDHFYDQAAPNQNKGYLGILIPRHLSKICCKLHNDAYRTQAAMIGFDGELSCRLGGSFFAAVVYSRNPQERSDEWRSIAQYLDDVLAGIGVKLDGPRAAHLSGST